MHDSFIRILIVDDNAAVRYGLSVFIEVCEDFVLVGVASNGQDAIVLCQKLQPDVVLMDLVMPVMNGIEATQRICHLCPGIQILVLTSSVETEQIAAALQAGAKGYLIKNVSIDTMASAIRGLVVS